MFVIGRLRILGPPRQAQVTPCEQCPVPLHSRRRQHLLGCLSYCCSCLFGLRMRAACDANRHAACSAAKTEGMLLWQKRQLSSFCRCGHSMIFPNFHSPLLRGAQVRCFRPQAGMMCPAAAAQTASPMQHILFTQRARCFGQQQKQHWTDMQQQAMAGRPWQRQAMAAAAAAGLLQPYQQECNRFMSISCVPPRFSVFWRIDISTPKPHSASGMLRCK